jgi:predicted O-methyltransferase YrrM
LLRFLNSWKHWQHAKRIFSHLTNEEKRILFRLARGLPKNALAVEIGSYLGASSCFLSLGLKARSGRLICVDTWQNDSMSEDKRDTFAEFSANTRPFRDIITPLRGRSEVLGVEFKEKISLLFLDGDHSYEAVSRDFFTWLPHMVKPAIIVLHDCGWAEGVQRAITEDIRPKAIQWRQIANMAWGCLDQRE